MQYQNTILRCAVLWDYFNPKEVKMQVKLKCAIYTRVSTDNQAEVEFNSCEAQEAKIMSFIKSADIKLY